MVVEEELMIRIMVALMLGMDARDDMWRRALNRMVEDTTGIRMMAMMMVGAC